MLSWGLTAGLAGRVRGDEGFGTSRARGKSTRNGCVVSSECAISGVLETQNLALYGKPSTGKGSTGMDMMCCGCLSKSAYLKQTQVWIISAFALAYSPLRTETRLNASNTL